MEGGEKFQTEPAVAEEAKLVLEMKNKTSLAKLNIVAVQF